MPTAAERAVDRGLAGAGVEELDQLGGQDWDVLGRHVRQCGHLRTGAPRLSLPRPALLEPGRQLGSERQQAS